MRPHVLVARLDSLGDVLLAGPAVRAAAAHAGRVTFLCGPRGRAAADLLPGVDEVVCFHAPWIDPEPQPVTSPAMLALVGEMAAREVDAAVILTSFHQSALPLALLCRMAGVPTVAAVSEDYPGSLLDLRHQVDRSVHEVERSLSLVSALGWPLPDTDDGRLWVNLPAGAEPGGPGLPRPPYVVVHPGASVPARAWPAEHHARLVRLLALAGTRVVVTGSRDEQSLTAMVAAGGGGRGGAGEGGAGEGGAGEGPAVVDLGGRTDLAGLARVLAGAAAVVVANTGPAHLAAAVGTPVVSLFAPTVPASRWRPWGVPHVLLGDQSISCAGCRARRCPVPGHPCLAGVGPEEVADGLAEVWPDFAAGRVAEGRELQEAGS